MRHLAALFLLSLACSSGAPTVYGQAAPSFRPLPPAWDAPSTTSAPTTTGQPGYIGTPERAPRGTDKRVLPPSREPGIWSADVPRATGDSDGPLGWKSRWPRVLDVDLLTDWPLTDDMSESDKHGLLFYIENVRACAAISDMALAALRSDTAFTDWRPTERRCLVAALHEICAVKDRARFEAVIRRATDEQKYRLAYAQKAYERNVKVSGRFRSEACAARGAYSARVMDAFTAVTARWETFDWRIPNGG